MASEGSCPLTSWPKTSLELKPCWRDIRYWMLAKTSGICILSHDCFLLIILFSCSWTKLGFANDLLNTHTSNPEGTPYWDRCSCRHLPGLWAVWTAASGPWPLRQPWDPTEAGGSWPGACRPGEGLGSAQDDAGPMSGAAGQQGLCLLLTRKTLTLGNVTVK